MIRCRKCGSTDIVSVEVCPKCGRDSEAGNMNFVWPGNEACAICLGIPGGKSACPACADAPIDGDACVCYVPAPPCERCGCSLDPYAKCCGITVCFGCFDRDEEHGTLTLGDSIDYPR